MRAILTVIFIIFVVWYILDKFVPGNFVGLSLGKFLLNATGISDKIHEGDNKSNTIFEQLKDKNFFPQQPAWEDQTQRMDDLTEKDQLRTQAISQKTDDLMEQSQMHSLDSRAN